MPDNPLVVALLRELRDEALVTRTEASLLLGFTRGQVAGICNRASIKPWPQVPPDVRIKRDCCFPIGQPVEERFRLCGNKRIAHPFLCEEHKGRRWIPQAKVLPLLRSVAVVRSSRVA